MTTTENPFEYRRPVAAAEAIGRTEEAERLEALAIEGNNARLIAPPGYGKTSLVRRVQERLLEARWATVYVRLRGVTTMAAFFGRVADALTRTLGPLTPERFFDRSAELAEESQRLSAKADAVHKAGRLASLLAQLLDFSAASGRRVHLAFDDFDDLDALPGKWEELLCSVIQYHGQAVSYLFAGSRRSMMQYAFIGTYRALCGQAVAVVIEPLATQPLRTYLAERFSATGKTLLPPALDALVELCGGHPRRAMQAAHHLWRETESEAGPEQWARARGVLVEELAGELEAAWRVFDPYERRTLFAVAMGEMPPSVIRANHPQAMLNAATEWLSGEAILARSGSHWYLVDPLLTQRIRSFGGPLGDERMERPHKTMRGMGKGVSTGEEEIADVRREMFRPLLGDEVDEVWLGAGEGSEQP